MIHNDKHPLSMRFREYYPVIIDVETAGLEPNTHALLQIAAITLTMDDAGKLKILEKFSFDIEPNSSCIIDKDAMKVNKIDLKLHAKTAIDENTALREIFKPIRRAIKSHNCKRGILVGHNAAFDLSFVYAACKRNNIKRIPFHPFSTFDTVTLAGLAFGQTTLKNACIAAKIDFDENQAHNAMYDAKKTAQIFCDVVNNYPNYRP